MDHDRTYAGYPTSDESTRQGRLPVSGASYDAQAVSPLQLPDGMDAARRQLGNRAFVQWMGALHGGDQDTETRVAAAAVPLQMRPKKKQKKEEAPPPGKQQETPGPPGATAQAEAVTAAGAQAQAEPAATPKQGETGEPGAAPGKKKKKPRVQVALNTLRAEGVEAFGAYIGAEIGEAELLHSLVERIKRAGDLGAVKTAALGVIQARMRGIDPGAGAAMARANRGQTGKKAVTAPVRTGLSRRECELFKACMKGDVAGLKRMLRHGNVDINLADEFGTFLCHATYTGHTPVVRELLTRPGIDVNLAHWQGATPFYLAVQQGHIEAVKLLMSTPGVDLNLGNRHGATPLYIATVMNRVEIVRLLLSDARINIDACKDSGATALFCAAQENRVEIAGLLIRHGADVNLAMNRGATPLSSRHSRVQSRDSQVVVAGAGNHGQPARNRHREQRPAPRHTQGADRYRRVAAQQRSRPQQVDGPGAEPAPYRLYPWAHVYCPDIAAGRSRQHC